MDIYKASLPSLNHCGFLTAGEDRVLPLTMLLNEEPQAMVGASFETLIPAQDGSTVVIPNAQHTIVDDGTPELKGRVDLELLPAQSRRLMIARPVRFVTRVTNAGKTIAYWGALDEVREQIR